ncbi:MAG TPA: hypothetical protein PLI34_11395, partial [Saprospiraceae bacterium]|nr:hypothetical protein [Saprospiraceae bacterium]
RDFISPLLGVRMVWGEEKLELYHPDGKKFLSYMELLEQDKVAQQFAEEQAKRAENAEQRAEMEAKRAEKLADMLRKLGIDPNGL